jgi:hypothetical protein
MARPGLVSHPKFRRLVHVLNVPVPHALGYLECMWSVCYERGDPLLGDALDVELAAQWPGEQGKPFKALLDCRFIDQLEHDRYEVHDLFDHAPDYVRKRREREHTRKHTYSHRGRPLTADWREEATATNNTAELGGGCPPNSADRRTTAELGLPPPPPPNASPNGEASAEPTSRPAVTAEEFRNAWNAVTQFPACRTMTDARKKHLRARLADPSWASSWREALGRAAKSSFLTGAGGGWRMGIDFFPKPDTVTKILEGNYDDRNGEAPQQKPQEDVEARMLADREEHARRKANVQACGPVSIKTIDTADAGKGLG